MARGLIFGGVGKTIKNTHWRLASKNVLAAKFYKVNLLFGGVFDVAVEAGGVVARLEGALAAGSVGDDET